MTINEITDKIIESKDNDIAQAFTMDIGNLLINNGIVPIMTEYTGNYIKNIADKNEHKLIMEYGISFKELDCSKHDKKIYNEAIDDFKSRLEERILDGEMIDEKFAYIDNYDIDEIAEQLKAGIKE